MTYNFKVSAFNDFGEGPFSNVLSIFTAFLPSGLANPTTSFDAASDIVMILWTPPTDDGGISSLTYTLDIMDVDGSWISVN